ncbi:MAG TPA: tetratricopeptide repeat protein [Gemmataceae bacterium]|nr:tetratricopeptide repeat protein [Gemmataceae bacterium]
MNAESCSRRRVWSLGLCAGLLLGGAAGPARALPLGARLEPLAVQSRSMKVGTALLVEFYRQLPERSEDEADREWLTRMQAALNAFQKKVAERYTEGTLQRLLESPDVHARRAAVLALGLIGTMDSNAALAARLRDEDRQVRQMANDALWSVWFRGGSEAHSAELQRLLGLRSPAKALAGLDALIRKAPDFAEAYNQRAIIYFRMKEFEKAVADCEKVLQLNPYHYGALSGMGQAHLNLRRPQEALKVFRRAFEINPNLESVGDAIRALENALGEEGTPEDKK